MVNIRRELEKIQAIAEKDQGWERIREEHKKEEKNTVEWYRTGLIPIMHESEKMHYAIISNLLEENHALKMKLRSTKGNLALMQKCYNELRATKK